MTGRAVVVGSDGRAKAYRPLPVAERIAAFEAGIAAYRAGDFFQAHEDLEPAWMGTDDLGERAFLQGLIKLAAAYVHGVRGNPAGIARNLVGARRLLDEARTRSPLGPGGLSERLVAIDLTALIAAIDRRLTDLTNHPGGPTLGPPDLPRSQP